MTRTDFVSHLYHWLSALVEAASEHRETWSIEFKRPYRATQ